MDDRFEIDALMSAALDVCRIAGGSWPGGKVCAIWETPEPNMQVVAVGDVPDALFPTSFGERLMLGEAEVMHSFESEITLPQRYRLSMLGNDFRSCHVVTTATIGGRRAAIVVWQRKTGPLHADAQPVVDRALRMLRFSLQRDERHQPVAV